jgi:hypothetical protein
MRLAYLMRTGLVVGVLVSATLRAEAQVEPRPQKGGPTYPVRIDSAPDQATIYLDDEKYGVVGTTPWTGQLAAGTYTVIVKKDGYQRATRTFTVTSASQTQESFVPLTRAEAAPAPAPIDSPSAGSSPPPTSGAPGSAAPAAAGGGGLRFVSTPGGATVLLDGEPIGQTPMVKQGIPLGDHVVAIEAEGYHTYENGVKVTGGEVQLVRATLQKVDTELSEEEKELEQRGLTTFGAKALPTGRSTLAIGAGYPYFAGARYMVGVGKLSEQFQFDLGGHFRSSGRRWLLSFIGRATLVDTGPFALGTFIDTGGGSTYFDDSKRDYFFFDGGLMASLTGLGAATLTGRAYLDLFTDRHCPRVTRGEFEESSPTDICKAYLLGTVGPETKSRIDQLVDGEGEIFSRDDGARIMLSIAIEIALERNWSLWALLEWAPRQEERAVFTDVFHSSMLEKDWRSYLTIGLTRKF